MTKESLNRKQSESAGEREKALNLVRNAFRGAHVEGSDRYPEIRVKNNPEVEQALAELGISSFPEEETLTISTWRDIGLLYELGLVDFGDESQKESVSDAIVHMTLPEVLENQHNVYQFPVQFPGGGFPTHTPKEPQGSGKRTQKKRSKADEDFHVPDSYEQLQTIVERWEQGKQDGVGNGVAHDYTKLPNLTLFKNQEYQWKAGKLYHLGREKDEREVSPAERAEILVRAREGDTEALAEIPKIHLGLVLSIVAELQKLYGGEADDMVQAGLEGLLYAVKKHDPNKGAFSTYASIVIDHFIRRQYGNTHRLIRRPIHRNTEVEGYYRTVESLQRELKREPSRLELSRGLGITDKKLDEFERQNGINREIVGLAHDDQLDSGHESMESPELLSELDDPVARAFERKELFEHMEQALNTLTPRELKVLRYRFGLGVEGSILERFRKTESEDSHLTLEQVATIFDVTRERIRQIETKALRKLRNPSHADLLEEYLSDRTREERERKRNRKK